MSTAATAPPTRTPRLRSPGRSRRNATTRVAAVATGLGANPVLVTLALLVTALAVVCAVRPSLVVGGNPLAIHPSLALKGPTAAHPFGTDEFGRDVLAQIVYGTRRSLEIGLVATAVGAVLGTLLGVTAGFGSGWVDGLLMRLVDVLMCFPGLLLALLLQAALGPGVRNEVLAVAAASIPTYARVSRGQAASSRSRPYLLAARSAGVRERTLLRRHVLPSVTASVTALATIGVGTSVVLAAALSFLGLGTANGNPDWGQLIGGGQDYLANAWWIATFPGLVITVVVLTAGILGDAVQTRLSGRQP